MQKKVLVFAALTALVAACLVPAVSIAQGKNANSEIKSTSARSRGRDTHIKTPRGANDPAAKVDRPPSKGGRSRGLASRYGTFHADNRTAWYIDVYLDGDFRGTVGPYGDLYREVIAGETEFYARAEFRDGTVKKWGPRSYDVPSGGTHTLRILE